MTPEAASPASPPAPPAPPSSMWDWKALPVGRSWAPEARLRSMPTTPAIARTVHAHCQRPVVTCSR
jgi:hypothetical protein